MFRLAKMFAGPLALLLLWPTVAPAQSGVDLIPDDATLAVTINSITRVRDKGEKYITDHELMFPQEARPSSAFDSLIKEVLGIKKGLDEKGAAAFILPSLKKNKIDPFNFQMLYYVAVPVADIDEMASNFVLKKGELKPGKVLQVSGPSSWFFPVEKRYILLKDKHLYVAGDEKALSLVPASKPVIGELSAEQQTAMTKADPALYIGAEELGELYRSIALNILETNLKRGDEADDFQSKQLIDALRQSRFLVGKLSLDDGGKITLIATFKKGQAGAAATKFLSSLRAGPDASDLIGLPAPAPWVAYGGKGDGLPNVARLRALRNIPFDQPTVGSLLPGQERQKFLASLETMYKELKGSRAALYPTGNLKSLGRFGLVGIVDFTDPEKHLAEWTTMVKLLNAAAEQAAKGGTRK